MAEAAALRHVFDIHLQIDLSAFATGRRVLGFARLLFLFSIPIVSKSTVYEEGGQPFEITPDLNYRPVADQPNCNYNLATT